MGWMRNRTAAAAGGWLPIALALAIAGSARAEIALGVHFAPALQPLENGAALVYELDVRNFDADCARLVDVEAEAGALRRRYQGTTIARNALVYDRDMRPLPNPAPGEDALHPVEVPPGGGAVVYFFVTLPAAVDAPETLRHTATFTACAAEAGALLSVVDESPVSSAPAVVVGLPFHGDGWVAGDSVNPTGTHRRTLIPLRDASGRPVTGRYHAPERYAIDWVVVDADAHRAIGPLDRNPSYLAWGREIVAVADGVVASTRDGMPEGTPPTNPPNPTVEMAAGNYVMQDIGNGRYAFYAHLQPGSLRVKQGDRVVRGQVLALLGNSGNSSEAHLHFHVSDASDPLMSEGVPFVFDRYCSVGQADGLDEDTGLFDDIAWHLPLTRLLAMPRSYSILDEAPPGPWVPRWPRACRFQ